MTKFQSTWTSVHQTKEVAKQGVVKNKPHPTSDEELHEQEVSDEEEVSDSGEDVVEDFDLSSADSD